MAYGACGTVRALAGHAHRGGAVDTPLTQADLAGLRDAFIATRQGVHLAGGLALLCGLMEEFEIAAVTPVAAGLRVGALWDLRQRAGAAV